jgi:hypothetical protein
LTDNAVQVFARHISQYGASLLGAEIMQKRLIEDQTIPPGEAGIPARRSASLLFGFDAEGEITGTVVMSLAGG